MEVARARAEGVVVPGVVTAVDPGLATLVAAATAAEEEDRVVAAAKARVVVGKVEA